jgi:uncharacterized protein (DUF433 family)
VRNLAVACVALTLGNASMAQVVPEDCQGSVMVAGQRVELNIATDIRTEGSAEALLAKMDRLLREMPADCGQFANRHDCEATKIVAKGTKTALEACIARAGSRAMATPPVNMSPAAATGSRNAAASAGGQIDPSLYNTEDNSDGNQIFRRMAAAGTPFVPKNPQQDHTGEPCVYFTKPLVRPDGGGLNAYADGGHVAYGKFYYVCQNRRWVRLGPASAFANVQEHAAERLENSALSPQVYAKE